MTDVPATEPTELEILKARLEALEASLVVAPPPVPTEAPTWTKFAGKVLGDTWKVVSGMKTVLFFGLAAAAGLADTLGAVDLTPYVQMFLPAGAKLTSSQVVLLMSLAGLILRSMTKSPMFTKATKADEAK